MNSGFSAECSTALGAAFSAKQSLPTSLMSAIEGDSTPDLSVAQRALEAQGVTHSTFRDRVLLREACVCVSTRAARLSAVGVGALLEMVDGAEKGCTIAIDVTVFECYPFFKARRRLPRNAPSTRHVRSRAPPCAPVDTPTPTPRVTLSVPLQERMD